MNTQMENYFVKPAGVIKDGSASYTANFDTGIIAYSGSVKAGFAFIKKTVPFVGTYKVDPNDLKSISLNSIGDVLKIETLNFKVMSVDANVASVDLSVDGQDMSGHACFDVSGEYLKLISLTANAKYAGMNLVINLQRA